MAARGDNWEPGWITRHFVTKTRIFIKTGTCGCTTQTSSVRLGFWWKTNSLNGLCFLYFRLKVERTQAVRFHLVKFFRCVNNAFYVWLLLFINCLFLLKNPRCGITALYNFGLHFPSLSICSAPHSNAGVTIHSYYFHRNKHLPVRSKSPSDPRRNQSSQFTPPETRSVQSRGFIFAPRRNR